MFKSPITSGMRSLVWGLIVNISANKSVHGILFLSQAITNMVMT
jgi:hypothetical protein